MRCEKKTSELFLMETRLNWFNFSIPFTQRTQRETSPLIYFSILHFSILPLQLFALLNFSASNIFRTFFFFILLRRDGGQWTELEVGRGANERKTFSSATSSHTHFWRSAVCRDLKKIVIFSSFHCLDYRHPLFFKSDISAACLPNESIKGRKPIFR